MGLLSPPLRSPTAMNIMTLHQYPNRAQVSNALIAYGVTAGLTTKLMESENVHKLLSDMNTDYILKLKKDIPADMQAVIKTIAPVFASVTCGLFAANVIMKR
jgi:hypothetical protein